MLYRLMSFSLLFLLFVACSGGSSPSPTPTISAPTEVTATAGAGHIRITWKSSSSEVTGFIVYRGEASGGSTPTLTELAEVPGDQTSYDDYTAAQGIMYTYAVSAKGPNGTSNRRSQSGGPVMVIPANQVPDEFTFIGIFDATRSTEYISNSIIVSGIDALSPITKSGPGSLLVDDAPFSGTTVTNGQTVAVVMTSSANYSTAVETTVTIGGMSSTFLIITESEPGEIDTTPDQFTFTNKTDVALGAEVESDRVLLTGFNFFSPISVTGPGVVYIDDSERIRGPLAEGDNDTIAVWEAFWVVVKASDDYSTAVETTVTIGGVSATFTVTTRAAPPTIVVTNTNDSGPGSLRQAVLNAGGGARITFAEDVRGTIILSSPLTLTDDITLVGPGRDELTLSGDDKVKIFTIPSRAVVRVSDIKLTNGFAANVDDILNDGGAIEMGQFSDLTLEGVEITNSKASDTGGGIMNRGGTLTLRNTSIVNNEAEGNGGGIAALQGTVTLIDSQIFGNSAKGAFSNRPGNGGGLWGVTTAVTVTRTSFNGNTTKTTGGGIGLFENSTFVMDDGTVSGNVAGDWSGGINLSTTDSTIRTSEINGNTAGSGGGVTIWEASLILEDSSLANNVALSGNGGGLYSRSPNAKPENFTVRRSKFISNSASSNSGNGGGIYVERGSLNMSEATVLNNSANRVGGGLYTRGGVIDKSLFSENATPTNCCNRGGGGIFTAGNLIITNSTIATNRGNYSGVWGGSNSITLTIRSSTVVLNQGFGISVRNLVTGASIIARNGTDIDSSCCNRTSTSLGYNLVGDGSGPSFGTTRREDLIGTRDFPIDPTLDPLADNGGPTQTIAPRAGSVVIGHIPAAFCSVTEDQRGRPRPGRDNKCDIGAFEVQ